VRVTLINNAAKRILKKIGITEDFIGKDVDLYTPNSRIKEVLLTGEVQLNEEQNILGITIVTNRVPRGYGLHLVKESIQRINGEIHIHSLVGKGTKITIEIPKSRDEK